MEKEKTRIADVPNSFKLFGKTIEVIWDKDLSNRDNATGMSK